jgi:hypothetical protein
MANKVKARSYSHHLVRMRSPEMALEVEVANETRKLAFRTGHMVLEAVVEVAIEPLA